MKKLSVPAKKKGLSQGMMVAIVIAVTTVLFAFVILVKSPEGPKTNDSRALYMQALQYLSDDGKPGKDEAKGMELLKKAGNAGVPEAQHRLGYVYSTGNTVVEKDDAQAIEYYTMAAKQGVPDSMVNLGLMLINNPKGIDDQKEGYKWWSKAAKRGHTGAIGNLGRCHELGIGTDVDYYKAMEHYRQAAARDDIPSLYNLGNMHSKGLSVVKDINKAIDYFKQATSKGYTLAFTALAEIYMKGVSGIEKDIAKALELLDLPSKNNDAKALYLLGIISDSPINNKGEQIKSGETNEYGVPYDPKKSHEYFQQASQYGSGDAMFKLALALEQGVGGIQADSTKAFTWLMSAAGARNGAAALEIYKKNKSSEYGGKIDLSQDELTTMLQLAVRSDDPKVRSEASKLLSELKQQNEQNEQDEGEEEEEEEEEEVEEEN